MQRAVPIHQQKFFGHCPVLAARRVPHQSRYAPQNVCAWRLVVLVLLATSDTDCTREDAAAVAAVVDIAVAVAVVMMMTMMMMAVIVIAIVAASAAAAVALSAEPFFEPEFASEDASFAPWQGRST